MLVVVEGASAAGKTTWCRRHAADATIEELRATAPPAGTPAEVADFWVSRQSGRWQQAIRLEAQTGFACCDTDPFKLHYTWCLRRLGRCSPGEWTAACEAHRRALREGDLGFADIVILLDVEPEELRRRRDADPLRTRRNFELHQQMAPLLRVWYSTLDSLEPGRLIVGATQLEGHPAAQRVTRGDPRLLDALIEALPK